ncbi:hypothetical protein [Rhizobium sp. MHM7A]|uniref:hypothetical protein n=1 Tax=Rhizobium sp. MHM7A TaxID=2583233 RepID=UPI001105F882|nr:hypothetical protein [Rhizobium sp. MHM7A]TLX15870.1 hypothetical protein FFR93_00720 [Rhizobium sp. MHM7A]
MDRYVIEHGDVWLKSETKTVLSSGLQHVCRGSEQLAIAFIDDQLLKMGSEASVRSWVEKNRLKVIGDGEIIVVSMPVAEATVAEFNACKENPNRVKALIENLTRLGVADPSLFDIPRYPI